MTSTGSIGTSVSLISRILGDDSRAWQQLVDLYGPLVQFWCRNTGLPAHKVEDCVQDVFVAVLKSIDKFDRNCGKGSFRGWLLGITRHKVVDTLRRETRQPDAVGGSTALGRLQAVEDPTEDDSQEVSRLHYRAMTQIKHEFAEKTWSAFCRTTIDGLTTAAVAEELSISPATVRQHRARILRRLRQQLGDAE